VGAHQGKPEINLPSHKEQFMNNSCVVKRRREIFMNYSSAKTEDIGFKFRCICDIANKYLKREEGEGGAVRR